MSDRQLLDAFPPSTDDVDDRVYTLDDVYRRKVLEDKTALYIAGPMTNHAQFNYGAFDALEAVLEEQGFVIASPARLDDPETRRAALRSADGSPGSGSCNNETWGDFLARDMKCIADIVDGVVLMPGWETSKGAKLEAFVCRHVGKPVFYSVAGVGLDGPVALHSTVCMCDDLIPEDLWRLIQHEDSDPLLFVELDDAELDRVLALTDGGLLQQIQQDELKAEFEAQLTGQPVSRTTEIRASGGKLPSLIVAAAGAKITPVEEVRITDAETGGQKGSKIVRMDLIPAEIRRQDGLVYGAGAKKYDDDNWRRGYDWRLSLSALFRHINAWEQGEDWDEELTELAGEPVSHLAAARWHLATLFTFQQEGLGTCTLPERPEFVGFPEVEA